MLKYLTKKQTIADLRKHHYDLKSYRDKESVVSTADGSDKKPTLYINVPHSLYTTFSTSSRKSLRAVSHAVQQIVQNYCFSTCIRAAKKIKPFNEEQFYDFGKRNYLTITKLSDKGYKIISSKANYLAILNTEKLTEHRLQTKVPYLKKKRSLFHPLGREIKSFKPAPMPTLSTELRCNIKTFARRYRASYIKKLWSQNQ